MKKALCLFLSVLLIVLSVPLAAGAVTSSGSGSCGDSLTWVVEKRTLTISGTGEMYDYRTETAPWADIYFENVVIEDGVTNISSCAFINHSFIETVTVSDTVKEIGYASFQKCAKLKKITLGNGVETISYGAFDGCTSLEEIIIPDSVKKIDSYVFSGCTALSKASIGKGVTSFGNCAFYGCTNLEDLTISDGVTEIGDLAFYNCTKLKNVIIPDSVKEMGYDVFRDCTGLLSVELSDNLETLPELTFLNCTSLASVTLGEKVNSIQYGAFRSCKALTRIDLSKNITFMDEPFVSCDNLTLYVQAGSYAQDYATENSLDYVVVVFADSVNLDKTEITLKSNALATLKATLVPSTTTDSSVTWTSSDESVAAVINGLVIAYKPGTATITAETSNNKKATCLVTVVCAHSEKTYVPAEDSTCSKHGHAAYKICDDCGEIISGSNEDLPLLEHSYIEKADASALKSAATCNSAAIYYKSCSVCGALGTETFESGEKDLANHSNNTHIINAKEATNKEAGYTGDVCCDDCGEILEYGIVIPKIINYNPKRLAGTSRVATAVEIAKSGWESADTVILANGYNFADALAGGPLSKALDAPILLTANKAILEEDIVNEISALGAKKVIILGGETAVNAEIELQLVTAGLTAERIAGANRYATAVEIAKKVNEINATQPQNVFIASGTNYPDALAISSIAAITGSPILFVNSKGVIDDATAGYLSECGAQSAVILGGTAAIGENAEENIANLGIASVERISGSNRFETAQLICNTYNYLFTSEDICIATGLSFPDALAGGSFAAKMGVPIILVNTKSSTATSSSVEYISGKNVKNVYILGGENAVSSDCVSAYCEGIE